MSAIKVGELAELVGGTFLYNPEQSEEMVDNLMIGAMCVDPAPHYFRTRSDKAVITRGDRADIQLGALETSTKCLVLTGGMQPIAKVMSVAEEKKVPIILVEKNTVAVLSQLEKNISQNQPEVIPEDASNEEDPTPDAAE